MYTRNLHNNEIDFVLKLLDLAKSITSKYDADIKFAIEGLEIGLKKYSQNKRQETKLDLYLVWYIKTSIEYNLGIENSETDIWKQMLKKSQTKSKPSPKKTKK